MGRALLSLCEQQNLNPSGKHPYAGSTFGPTTCWNTGGYCCLLIDGANQLSVLALWPLFKKEN